MSLLDMCAPRYDFSLREHRIAKAGPDRVWAAAPSLRSVRPRLLPRPDFPFRPAADLPGFDEVLASAPWQRLATGENEVVMGAAGRFWTPFMDWHRVGPGEFDMFDRPCRATLAVSVSLWSYDPGRTLLTWEARARATDNTGFRWADWYWSRVRPTAKVIMRELVLGLCRAAEAVPVGS